MRKRTRRLALLTEAIVLLALTGCSDRGYHGMDSGSDGVQWRQISAFEDDAPWFRDADRGAAEILTDVTGAAWDRAAEPVPDIREGAMVLYDVSTTASTADFSVFISSGPRPDVPRDEGGPFIGPSEVYTCYALHVDVRTGRSHVGRTLFSKCPTELVDQLPDDAAFASGEVFDG